MAAGVTGPITPMSATLSALYLMLVRSGLAFQRKGHLICRIPAVGDQFPHTAKKDLRSEPRSDLEEIHVLQELPGNRSCPKPPSAAHGDVQLSICSLSCTSGKGLS